MEQQAYSNQGQAIYFSHGGGPLPLLEDPSHKGMIDFMRELPLTLKKPEAIVVFSAHWEEAVVTIQSNQEPSLMYDYYGFPKEAYSIEYGCKGHHVLAKKIETLLNQAQIECRLDDKRPYDHGSYIPLKLMYPEADIPVIQVSLHANLEADTHLLVGKSLSPLLQENILFIGSGFSFHNMRAFDFSGQDKVDSENNEFQDWLIDLCCDELDETSRWEMAKRWEKVPHARYCHPRQEHLVPIFVCIGLSGKKGKKVFDDYILGKRATAFYWDSE